MDRPEQEAARQPPAPAPQAPEAHEPISPPSEFVCPGCGCPLNIVLHSTMCFAEAQVYCPDCERDYQHKRGRWQGR